jgi:membrane protease YdiL (CAAX protease family)
MNPLIRNLSPIVQFILFLGMLFICSAIGAGAALGVGSAFYGIPLNELPGIITDPQPKHAMAMIWMNNTTQLFSFFLPAVLFYMLIGAKSMYPFLTKSGGIMLFVAPILMVFANGVIDLSSKLNHALIPAGSWLEQKFKPSEEMAERLSELFLRDDSGVHLWVLILSMAVVPAIFEELVFRGILQPLIARMSRNVHVGIWLSAALFSLIHMQFYGFIPRLLLGAVLGYLVIWSGSLWTAIFAHFVNNALAVLMYKTFGSLETPEDSTMSQWYGYVVSTSIFVALVYWFYKRSRWPWLSFEYLGITPGSRRETKLKV